MIPDELGLLPLICTDTLAQEYKLVLKGSPDHHGRTQWVIIHLVAINY
jgi:hypothetical protein